MNAEVLQGSLLDLILYTIFTSDIPETENILVATYAALLSSSHTPVPLAVMLLDDSIDNFRLKRQNSLDLPVRN